MKFRKQFATVFVDEKGQHMIVLPSGEVFPGVAQSIVHDEAHETATCQITFHVNLCQTKEQALEKYNEEE